MNQSNVLVFDLNTVARHRDRAEKMNGDHDFLFNHVAGQLDDRLADIKRDFTKKIDLQAHLSTLADHASLNIAPQSAELITSLLNLHWVNDLPGRLFQINKALKPDGAFLGALFGGETLYELRESLMTVELEMFGGVSPRVSPFVDMRDMGALLQRAGFTLPVVDHEIVQVTYDHVFSLIADLRGMGQTNAIINRSNRYVGRAFWARVQEYYHDHFVNDKGRLTASFEVIYFIGWAPDASQQQPLKPGSATQSLAQVLNTTEIKLPEKANPKK